MGTWFIQEDSVLPEAIAIASFDGEKLVQVKIQFCTNLTSDQLLHVLTRCREWSSDEVQYARDIVVYASVPSHASVCVDLRNNCLVWGLPINITTHARRVATRD